MTLSGTRATNTAVPTVMVGLDPAIHGVRFAMAALALVEAAGSHGRVEPDHDREGDHRP